MGNWRQWIRSNLRFSAADTLVSLGILLLTTVLSFSLSVFDQNTDYASMLYVLAVFLIARMTDGYFYGVAASLVSVLLVNFLFTYPNFAFNFTISGYPIAIVSMLTVSIATSTLTTQAKFSAQRRLEAEREKTRSNLLRAVSHDLRTPLTGILGASSAMLENDEYLSKDERMEFLRNMQEDAQWLIRMVENLLSVTRIDGTSSTRITKTEEPAEEVIDESLQKFHKRFPDTEVQVSIPDELIMIPMDPLLIEQVIINLLENAALHAGSAVHIHIKLESQQDFALFTVSDDGRGIDPRILPHIFESGIHTIDAERSDQRRNMGIGLSVCDTIIRAHGGQMHAANADEGGAVFTFTLPIEEAHV